MDFIDEFNKKQMNKAMNANNFIIRDYKKMIEMIKYIKTSFQMLKTVLEKKNGEKIVSKSIRQTYHVLSSDFANKFNNMLKSMLLLQNINVFIKNDIGRYTENNLINLLLFDIFIENEIINIIIDEECFVLKHKIKAHVLNYQDLSDTFYKEKNNKYFSTNYMAMYIIEESLENLEAIENIIINKINQMIKLVI